MKGHIYKRAKGQFVWVAPIAVALSFLVGYLIKKLPTARNIL